MLISKQQYGKVLDAAGLSFLPDAYNLDDGLVERARQNMQMAHPNLDNVSWLNLAIVEVSRGYAAEHPVFQAQVPPSITDLLAAGMHQQIHGTPVPKYVDASDSEAAAAERADALSKKAVADAEAALAKVAEVKANAVPGGKMHEFFGTIDGADLGRGSSTDGLPSAEDLDAVEAEKAMTAPQTSALPAGTDNPELVIETKHYSDGSSATGVAPLPDQSPEQQAAAAAEYLDKVAEEEKLKALSTSTDKVQ